MIRPRGTRSWLVLFWMACTVVYPAAVQQSRLLECTSVFGKDASAASLSERFGAANVRSAEIYLGEGFYESGTVLFANSVEDRVEILWKNIQEQRMPKIVRISGARSHWRTTTGLTLGVDLLRIEKLNRRPFRLLGFAWDYSGTVMSWSGGSIGSPPAMPCTIRARLRPEGVQDAERQISYRQVLGDREFSSGHPAMQALNPSVYEVWLDYGRQEAR